MTVDVRKKKPFQYVTETNVDIICGTGKQIPTRQTGLTHFIHLLDGAVGSMFQSSTPADVPTAKRLLQWGLGEGGGGRRGRGRGRGGGEEEGGGGKEGEGSRCMFGERVCVNVEKIKVKYSLSFQRGGTKHGMFWSAFPRHI